MTSTSRLFSRIGRGMQMVFGGGSPVANARKISSALNLVEQYKKNGRIPWSPGYAKFKTLQLIETLADTELMDIFRSGASLPEGFGVRLDANSLPAAMPLLVASVLAGGWLGTALGLQRLPTRGLLWALAAVLLVAGGKLLLPAH